MALHPKAKRRLLILIVGVVVLVVGAGFGYVVRQQQLESRALASRDEGIKLLESGDYFNALHKIGPYVSRHPDDAAVLHQYALARENVREPNGKHLRDAMGMYRRVLAMQPAHEEAATRLLTLYDQHGMTAEALELSDRVLKLRPEDLVALRVKAWQLFIKRDYDASHEVALQWAAADETNLQAHRLVLLILERRPEGAVQTVEYVDGVRDAQPDSAVGAVLQVYSLLSQEDLQGAKAAAIIAAGKPLVNPQNVKPVVDLLEDEQLGLLDEALAVLEREATTDQPELRARLAQMRFERGKYEALASMEAPGNSIHSDEIRVFKALALIADGKTTEAGRIADELNREEGTAETFATSWSKVLKARLADPADPGALSRAARSALDVAPGDARLHYVRGVAQAELGEADAAIQSFATAAQRARRWKEPFAALIPLMLDRGKLGDAEAAARMVLSIQPDQPDALYAVAIAGAARADPADEESVANAEAAFEKLRGVDEGDRYLPLMVRLLLTTGREDQAKQEIVDSLAEASVSARLQLAELSRLAELGLEDQIIASIEATNPIDPRLTQFKAQRFLTDGETDAALELVTAAIGKLSDDDKLPLEILRAQILSRSGDPKAKETWIAIADAHPDNATVQWRVLAAAPVRSDRPASGAILSRLKDQVGKESATWRLARSRWLLEDREGTEGALEAAKILNGLTKERGATATAHLLLAEAIYRLDPSNVAGAAEQLARAAALEPTNAAIALDLAKMLHAGGDVPGTRERLSGVLQNPAATAEQRREAAMMAAALGDPATALATLQQQADEGEEISRLLLASLYRQTNQPAIVDQMVEEFAGSTDAAELAFAADWHWQRDRAAEADAAIVALQALSGEPVTRHLLVADLMRRRGEMDTADAEYEAAIAADPTDARGWQERTKFLIARGDLATARTIASEGRSAVAEDVSLGHAEALLAKAVKAAPEQREVAGGLVLAELADQGAGAEQLLDLVVMAGPAVEGDELREVRTVADSHPRNLPVQLAAAMLHLNAGDTNEAVTIASRAMEIDTRDPRSAEIATKALEAAERWDEMLAMSREWRARQPGAAMEIDSLVAEANMALGNPSSAFRSLEPYLELARSRPEEFGSILGQVAVARARMGDTEEAFALLRPLLTSDPAARGNWAVIAGREVQKKDVALAALEELASAIDAEDAAGQVVVAEACTALAGRFRQDVELRAQAMEALTRASELAAVANQAYLHLSIGSQYDVLAEPRLAEAEYRATLKLVPNEPIAQNNLAMMLLAQDRLEEALELSQAASKADHPNRADFLETLAQIQIAQKQYEPAVQTLRTATSLSPGNFPVHLRLAEALIEAGRPADAKAVLDGANPLKDRASEEGQQRFDALVDRVASIR